jgi:hypothetical protein
MIPGNEWRIKQYVERCGRGLFENIFPDIRLERRKKITTTSVKVARVTAKIPSEHLPKV